MTENGTTKGLKRAAGFVYAEASSCPHKHTRKEARDLARKIYTRQELRLIGEDRAGDEALHAGMKVWRGEWERIDGQPGLYRSADPDSDPNLIINIRDFREVGPGPRWLFVFAGLSKTTHVVEEVVGRVIREYSDAPFPRPTHDERYYVLLLVERETEEETRPSLTRKRPIDLEARAAQAFGEALPDLAKKFAIHMPPKEPEPEIRWFRAPLTAEDVAGAFIRDEDGQVRPATPEERDEVRDRVLKSQSQGGK